MLAHVLSRSVEATLCWLVRSRIPHEPSLLIEEILSIQLIMNRHNRPSLLNFVWETCSQVTLGVPTSGRLMEVGRWIEFHQKPSPWDLTAGCFILEQTPLGLLTTFAQTSLKTTEEIIGVRAGEARGAAAPPNFGQLRFFGQREKIWAKPVF